MDALTHKFSFDGVVTARHRAFYDRYGFIHFKDFLSAADLSLIEDILRHTYARVIREHTQVVNGIPVRYGRNERGETIVQRLPYTSALDGQLESLLLYKGIGLLSPLINRPDCRLGFNEQDGLVTNFFLNAPGSTYRQMGWHTDGLRDLLLGRPLLPMINIGFYLDDSGTVNGGLRIIPGTHTQGISGMLFKKLQLLDKKPDKNEFPIIAGKGDMVLHDCRLWHRVAPAPITGSKSTRRIMYVPLICGKPNVRTANSPTPLYQAINKYSKYQ